MMSINTKSIKQNKTGGIDRGFDQRTNTDRQ